MNKLIGDRAFYRRLIAIMFPILIQNVITNFVSLLDNIMVGQVGTEPMSGVAIVNQLLFVYNLCIFGGLAGAGIFTAQYYGNNDNKGVADTFRGKVYIALGVIIIGFVVLGGFGKELIMQFIHEGGDGLDMAATLGYGRGYLNVMLWQLAPFALMQVYSSTLRETGETVLPMKAGLTAVFVNLVLNYILIFGKLGAPAMGVVGAAVATVISRYVECGIVAVWAHTHKARVPYIEGVYSTLHIPLPLVKQIVFMGLPLLVNELFWAGGMTMLNQCYSMRGLEVVSAVNICTTISQLFFCGFQAMGVSISIIVGQLLGSGDLERAVEEDTKLIIASMVLSAVVGLVMAVISPFIPRVYNTTDAVKALATTLILINAAMMPVNAFTNACYFTIRSGGKTIVTFIFDSVYLWVLCIPLAYVLSRYTDVAIVKMYIAVLSMDLVKSAFGLWLVKEKKWVVNLVSA